jgi:hypothetical protein
MMIEQVGGFEEHMHGIYQLMEDQAFLVKAYLNVPVFVSSKCWDKYRLHLNSCCSKVNSSGQQQAVRLYLLNWMETYFIERGVNDDLVWKALKKELWPYRHQVLYKLKTFVQRAVEKPNKIVKLMAKQTSLAGQ